jgi:hypothetical protein
MDIALLMFKSLFSLVRNSSIFHHDNNGVMVTN